MKDFVILSCGMCPALDRLDGSNVAICRATYPHISFVVLGKGKDCRDGLEKLLSSIYKRCPLPEAQLPWQRELRERP